MKKIISALFLLIVATNSFIYSSNNQKIQNINSDIYFALSTLYISQGLPQSSTAKPYSSAEFIMALEALDTSKMNDGEKDIYDYIYSIVEESPKVNYKDMGYSFTFDTNLELYYHDNIDYIGRDKWVRGWEEQLPFFGVGLESWSSDIFYGFSEFTLQNYYHTGGESDLSKDFGYSSLLSNIPMLTSPLNPYMLDLNLNFPYRAFVSAGGDSWTVQVGRDRVSWGPGLSGNFMLGEHVPYHNMLRFTTYSPIFKYTFISSFFPHPSLYYNNYEDETLDATVQTRAISTQNQLLSGINMFMAHRLEWNVHNLFNFAINESIMYQNIDNFIDLQIFNPASIYHNYYIKTNANSLLTFETDFTPIKNINIYAQVAIDEFRLLGEGLDYPSAFGFMLGLRGAYPIKKGLAYGSIEWVKTDPYLYLRGNSSSTDSSKINKTYGINYVIAIRNYSDKTGLFYDEAFLGYEYGNDTIVTNLNLGFKKFGKWGIEGNIFYMQSGTFDMWTAWEGFATDTTPTTSHDNYNYNDSDTSDRDSVESTLVVGINGQYQINNRLNTFTQLDFITIKNFNNISSSNTLHDIQLSCGIGLKY